MWVDYYSVIYMCVMGDVLVCQASLIYLLRERFYRQVMDTALGYLKLYPNDPVLLFFKAFATLNEGNVRSGWGGLGLWCASGDVYWLCWWVTCCVLKDGFRRLWKSWTVWETCLRSPCAQWWRCCGRTGRERTQVSQKSNKCIEVYVINKDFLSCVLWSSDVSQSLCRIQVSNISSCLLNYLFGCLFLLFKVFISSSFKVICAVFTLLDSIFTICSFDLANSNFSRQQVFFSSFFLAVCHQIVNLVTSVRQLILINNWISSLCKVLIKILLSLSLCMWDGEAVSELESSLKRAKRSAGDKALYYVALLYWILGRNQKAREYIDKMLKFSDGSAEVCVV